MGDVVLNVVLAILAAVVAWFAIYYCPPAVATFIERELLRFSAPLRWSLRPFLRFMGITDRE